MQKVRDGHRGITVSAAQLERWRRLGLLPRVQVTREGFGGSIVPPHSEQVVEAAALLGSSPRKVRPWQRKAELLFNNWLPLSQVALQAAAVHLVADENAKLTALWDAARVEESLDDECPDDAGLLGEIVAMQVESLRRQRKPLRAGESARRDSALLKAVRKEIELAHADRKVTKRDLEDYVSNALTWRVVDLVRPGALSQTHRNLARHGVEEPLTPIGDGAYPLPSERVVVAQSLSWAEAEQYRPFAQGRIKANPVLARRDFGLLWVTIWIVAYERLKMRAHPLESPLPQSQLDRAAALLPPAQSE